MPALIEEVGGVAGIAELHSRCVRWLPRFRRFGIPVMQKQDGNAGVGGLVGVVDEGCAVGRIDAVHGAAAIRRRSKSRAACDARARISPRSPGKMRRNARTSAPYRAANHTVPTGFSAVPPVGPAIPVTANAASTANCRCTPPAIALTTCSETAPY